VDCRYQCTSACAAKCDCGCCCCYDCNLHLTCCCCCCCCCCCQVPALLWPAASQSATAVLCFPSSPPSQTIASQLHRCCTAAQLLLSWLLLSPELHQAGPDSVAMTVIQLACIISMTRASRGAAKVHCTDQQPQLYRSRSLNRQNSA
jgi:hypothetical protein